MDIKEEALIRDCHHRVLNSSFDEKDVFTLLILLREHSPKISALREFAHFVAHRTRNRGDFHLYIQQTKKNIEMIGTARQSTLSRTDFMNNIMNAQPVFTVSEIGDSLNNVLASLGFSAFSDEQVKGIVLCLISLLQEARFLDDSGVEVGKLFVALNDKKIILFGQVQISSGDGVMFPVLSIDNQYIEFKQIDETHVMTAPNNLIQVANDNGTWKVVSA